VADRSSFTAHVCRYRPWVNSGPVATGYAVIKLQFISLTCPLTLILTLTLTPAITLTQHPQIRFLPDPPDRGKITMECETVCVILK